MQQVNNLINANVLWLAESCRDKSIQPDGIKDPAVLFSTGLNHEFFFDYSDKLVTFPPVSPVISYLRQLCLTAWNSESTKRLVICIGRDVWPTPYFLRDCFRGSAYFENFIFINPTSESQQMKSLEIALRSDAVVAVITTCKKLSFPFTQRMLLLSKSSNARSFIFRNHKEIHSKSSAHTRWLITPTLSTSLAPSWRLLLLSNKGAKITHGEWVVEVGDEQTISKHLLPELVGQSSTEKAACVHCA